MSDIFISIVIPTFNEEERIGALLKHLEKCCSDISHEIIVADGGSNDRTVKTAESYGVKVLHCQKKGRAAQMNEGAEISKGGILYFLHADTYPPKTFIDDIRITYNEGYKSGCFQLEFDDPHPLLRFYGWFTRFRLTLFRFGDQSLFVEKILFEEVGGFDESMIVMEDQKIVLELKKASSFKLLDERVTTSARRYKINGIIRLQAVFFLIVFMYYLGANQTTLVHVYKQFIKS